MTSLDRDQAAPLALWLKPALPGRKQKTTCHVYKRRFKNRINYALPRTLDLHLALLEIWLVMVMAINTYKNQFYVISNHS